MLEPIPLMSDISDMRTSARFAPLATLTAGVLALAVVAAWPAHAAPCGDPTGLTCSTTTTTTAPPATQPSIPPLPTTTTTTAAPARPAASLPASAAHLFALVNQDRADAGLPPVAARGDVESIAVGHSFAMAKSGSIWHNDDYFTESTRARLGASVLGENVASNSSIDDANRRLMASPGHRANLLDRRFSVIGIGVVDDGTGYLYITEDFVDPITAARIVAAGAPRHPAPAAAPAPVALTSAPSPGPGEIAPVAAPADVAPTPVTLGPVSLRHRPAHHRPTPLLPLSAGALLAVAVTVGAFSLVTRSR